MSLQEGRQDLPSYKRSLDTSLKFWDPRTTASAHALDLADFARAGAMQQWGTWKVLTQDERPHYWPHCLLWTMVRIVIPMPKADQTAYADAAPCDLRVQLQDLLGLPGPKDIMRSPTQWSQLSETTQVKLWYDCDRDMWRTLWPETTAGAMSILFETFTDPERDWLLSVTPSRDIQRGLCNGSGHRMLPPGERERLNLHPSGEFTQDELARKKVVLALKASAADVTVTLLQTLGLREDGSSVREDGTPNSNPLSDDVPRHPTLHAYFDVRKDAVVMRQMSVDDFGLPQTYAPAAREAMNESAFLTRSGTSHGSRTYTLPRTETEDAIVRNPQESEKYEALQKAQLALQDVHELEVYRLRAAVTFSRQRGQILDKQEEYRAKRFSDWDALYSRAQTQNNQLNREESKGHPLYAAMMLARERRDHAAKILTDLRKDKEFLSDSDTFVRDTIRTVTEEPQIWVHQAKNALRDFEAAVRAHRKQVRLFHCMKSGRADKF